MKKVFWLIWKNPTTRNRYKVGTLTIHENNFDFRYDKEECNFKDIEFDFFPGFNDVNKIYSSKSLFENIVTRLPNKNRPDYVELIESYGLNIYSTDIDILEKTRGRLLTDTFEFVLAFNYQNIEFEVAGVRHSSDFKKCKNLLEIGRKLVLEIEGTNKYDKYAIIIKFNEYKLGYVPRFYSKGLYEALKNNIFYDAYISNLNFNSKIFDEAITVNVKLELKNNL